MKRSWMLGVAASLVVGAPLAAILKSPPLLTADQNDVATLALSLRDADPIHTARAAAIERFKASPAAQSPDGKATLDAAVDETVTGALVAAANDPAHPKVVWNAFLPYHYANHDVPGARFGGDNPDRIYRSIAVDPAYSYEIHGWRNPKPSLDFSFEAIPAPSLFGQAQAALQAKDIDVAADGSFVVTADAQPDNGRRNHLQLPPNTANILVRDTLADWSTQLPNKLQVRRLSGGEVAAISHDALTSKATTEVNHSVDESLKFLDTIWKAPANHIEAHVRGLKDGVKGGVIAVSHFDIADDEVLLVTLDPIGARYVGFELTDPWLRSLAYKDRSASLSNQQAKPNADGSITYVLAAKDPGVYNWLDTNGLHDGGLLIRWELFSAAPDASKAVREVHKLKSDELAVALKPGTAVISAAERQQLLTARSAAYDLRVASR